MRTCSDEANDDDDEEEVAAEEVAEEEEERGLVVPISSWVKHVRSGGDGWYRNADNDSMRVMYLLIVLLLF
jgi:hypothetical protein